MPTQAMLAAYWTAHQLQVNGIIVLNLLGALLLGLMVGYERSYHGRAAGMRTYGIVCMASAALTIIGGYPDLWFGGHGGALIVSDPTRIIQGVVTGIGFLGAGVIMREGFNISGLTTAASIWASSVIGILVGIGFYAAAIVLAALSAVIMIYLQHLEAWLPSRHAVAIMLKFKSEYIPREGVLRTLMLERGYDFAGGSLSIGAVGGAQEWRFVAVALSRSSGVRLSELADELNRFDGLDSFQLAHARN
ncbi:MgtC/SapB family protein [Massilia sp. PWRC2]|uniref:MgtC/SapB family protein n=1 Tax=Massilia sp. PWRC2 TaxID=2804626 RepID=UPI003CF449D8